MNNFSFGKAIGFGALIWAILFLVGIGIAGMGITLGAGAWVTMAILAGVLSYLFAMGTDASGSAQALSYGAMFVVVGVILDALFSRLLFAGIFGLWQYYVGYALVLFAPLLEYGLQGSGAHPKAV